MAELSFKKLGIFNYTQKQVWLTLAVKAFFLSIKKTERKETNRRYFLTDNVL